MPNLNRAGFKPIFHYAFTLIYSQDGTAGEDTLKGVAIQADGSILLAGYTEGDWDGESAGERDFIMVALSADGEELWRWQVKLKSPKHYYLRE